ncbi:MAG: metallophosphoesterase, partial [Verrucomicrobiota bacterium]|nr:metallophosphoesterase [Verrucomicrobiota bacterium]
MKLMTRRQFLTGSALAGAGGLGGIGYVRLFEPRWLQVARHQVPLSGTAVDRPVTLLQLSDFHASPVVSLDYIDRAVRLGLAQNPDLICLTGDYFTWTLEKTDQDRYARILAQLSRGARTFACLGNHDGGRWAGSSHGYKETMIVRQLLSDAGVT